MPANRAEWARAMLAEAEHLPRGEQLGFALGCVWSGYRERLSDAATMLAAARLAIVVGLCMATAVCLRTSFVLRSEDPSVLILALGIIALSAAFAVIRWELRRLPAIAIMGFAAALLAMLALGDVNALVGGAMPSSRFYRAILLEQAAAWAALLGLAHFLLAFDARRGANR